jgi:hypothetical protein
MEGGHAGMCVVSLSTNNGLYSYLDTLFLEQSNDNGSIHYMPYPPSLHPIQIRLPGVYKDFS